VRIQVFLHYGLDLTVSGFFLERRFRRVNCFLEEARITFYKIAKEVFTERCESPNSFALLGSMSIAGAELEEGISEYKKGH